MSEQPWSWTVSTNFASRLGAHDDCMREVLAQLDKLGWGCSDLFAIQMALEESLTNAIRHGNRQDESKLVHVECKASPARFWLRVEDEGPGFDPDCVPDCTTDENLERCGGRGLALIKAYMTRVEYNDRGNCVTMEKCRDIMLGEAALQARPKLAKMDVSPTAPAARRCRRPAVPAAGQPSAA